MAEQVAGISFESEGMEDLGSLPMETQAILNKNNGEIVRQSDYVFEGGPGMDAWTMVVRFANSHQKDYEFINEEKAEKGAKDAVVMPDGSKVTMNALKKLHHKTLLKFATGLSVEMGDKPTPLQIQERTLAKVNSMNHGG